MRSIAVDDARRSMAIGDVIAFGGATVAAGVIKLVTSGTVTHVALLMEPEATADGPLVRVLEMLPGKGVCVMDLAMRLEKTKVDVWWLPLHTDVRASLDVVALRAYLDHVVTTRPPYDTAQAIGAVVDWFDGLPSWLLRMGYNEEDLTELFCSELVAAALRKGNAIPQINASEVTPIEVCQWDIYAAIYYQLAGAPSEGIPGYNTRPIRTSSPAQR